MGDTEKITTDALRRLATSLDQVKSTLEEAGREIEDAAIGGGAFSHYGVEMAIAYASAHDFAKRDAQSKAAHIETIQERLRSTANVWDEAERASTVAPHG